MNKSDIDLIPRLRISADLCSDGDLPDTTTLAELQRLAADEIERLRKRCDDARGPVIDPCPTAVTFDFTPISARFDAIDARLAALEFSVRLHGHRLDAAREAMRECAASDRLHNSVRFVADTLAINLGSNPPEGT